MQYAIAMGHGGARNRRVSGSFYAQHQAYMRYASRHAHQSHLGSRDVRNCMHPGSALPSSSCNNITAKIFSDPIRCRCQKVMLHIF